jgi:hypothetical protein
VGATSEAAAIRELEARLRRPEKGENGYREGVEARSRLETLRRLRELAEEGRIQRSGRRGGVNTHVHTAKSFGYFESPSDAVWQAYLSRLSVFGINDHYTLAGHEEFGKACRITGIRPTFSMEAIAMWEEAEREGLTVNDPANPGRTYISAKGTTRDFPPGCSGAANLERMNATLLERNREITRRLSGIVRERLGVEDAVTWPDVLSLTPHGQPTERHIALAAARFLESASEDTEERRALTSRLLEEETPSEVMGDAASFQNHIRAGLIKAGRPAYVPESQEAFIPVEAMVSLALDLAAIPTYPVLGNPVTPWEEDIDRLFDRLEALGIHAIEVIPDRNTRERLLEIVTKAAERGIPVFNGTEHNTRVASPLVDGFFFDEAFRPRFEQGARVLLGHQKLRKSGQDGYVRDDGTLPPGDRAAHLVRVQEAGRRR